MPPAPAEAARADAPALGPALAAALAPTARWPARRPLAAGGDDRDDHADRADRQAEDGAALDELAPAQPARGEGLDDVELQRGR